VSLWDVVTGWVSRDAQRYVYAAVGQDRVLGAAYEPSALQARRDYFRLWLVEMCLKRDRAWFVSWHPAVHSIVRFQFGSRQTDIPGIAGESSLLDVDRKNLDRVIQLNYPMTTLLPYNGGTVELTAGLLAMEGTDLIAGFIKTMGNFANLLMMPQLSAAVSVATPIAAGVEQLLKNANGGLHLGLHQAFAGEGGGANEFRPGYLVVVLATEKQVKPGELWVKDGRLHMGRSGDELQPLSGFAYMLFRIEKRADRDDWEGLTAIRDPYNSALGALEQQDGQRAETFFRVAVAEALRSPDLTQADRIRVARALKDEFDQAKELGLGAIPVERPTLTTAMARSISADQALALGVPTFDELFS
jgi:hypothetical protein